VTLEGVTRWCNALRDSVDRMQRSGLVQLSVGDTHDVPFHLQGRHPLRPVAQSTHSTSYHITDMTFY
jgi:hypothetical protein